MDADTNGDLGHCYRPRGLRRGEESQTRPTTFSAQVGGCSFSSIERVAVAWFGRTDDGTRMGRARASRWAVRRARAPSSPAVPVGRKRGHAGGARKGQMTAASCNGQWQLREARRDQSSSSSRNRLRPISKPPQAGKGLWGITNELDALAPPEHPVVLASGLDPVGRAPAGCLVRKSVDAAARQGSGEWAVAGP